MGLKKIGILYISTGKYTIFWKDFYETAEKNLLTSGDYEKHYFVFTDAENLEYEQSSNVHKVHQEALPWPYITLDRFSIFQKARNLLENMDFLYFFNGNMLFVDSVGDEILPTEAQPLVFVKHPGFFDKKRQDFSYENNPSSTAFIPDDEGDFYFMGGMNGGKTSSYLEMVEQLENNILLDKANNIIAVWHDESHLNNYAVKNSKIIKVLDSSYGYPEGWKLPFNSKILIRNKSNYGGHDFLRNEKKSIFEKIKAYFR